MGSAQVVSPMPATGSLPIRPPLELAKSTVPAQVGIGLRPQQLRAVLELRPNIGFFEVHAENFMMPGGPVPRLLDQVRESYPLSVHGVGLSVGGADRVDELHLERLAKVVDRFAPGLVSEHLAWSCHEETFLCDLLPVRYTTASLRSVIENVDRIQSRLKRQILLENPSAYFVYAGSEYSEGEFISEVVRASGCGLLLDVANVHVSSVNNGRDALAYLESLPLDAVREVHLAGHSRDASASKAPLLIDDHGSTVDLDVKGLYAWVLARLGPVPTLIERDNNIPPMQELLAEANAVSAQYMEDQAGASIGGREHS